MSLKIDLGIRDGVDVSFFCFFGEGIDYDSSEYP